VGPGRQRPSVRVMVEEEGDPYPRGAPGAPGAAATSHPRVPIGKEVAWRILDDRPLDWTPVPAPREPIPHRRARERWHRPCCRSEHGNDHAGENDPMHRRGDGHRSRYWRHPHLAGTGYVRRQRASETGPARRLHGRLRAPGEMQPRGKGLRSGPLRGAMPEQLRCRRAGDALRPERALRAPADHSGRARRSRSGPRSPALFVALKPPVGAPAALGRLRDEVAEARVMG